VRVNDQRAFLAHVYIDRYRALIHARAAVKANEAVAEVATISVVNGDLRRLVPDHLAVVDLRRVCDVDRAVEAEAGEGGVPVW